MRASSLLLTFIFLMLLFPKEAVAQDSLQKEKKRVVSKTSKAAKELQEALSENDETAIAKKYEALAVEFTTKNDLPKAEFYLKKALISYTKGNFTSDKTRVTRSLAKVQEAQKKFGSAIKNYEEAGALADDKSYEKINTNDAKRLRSPSNAAVQSNYIQSNIELLEKSAKTDEVAAAYIQKAEASLEQKDKEAAIESYQKAITYSKTQPEEIIKFKNEIAKVYASKNQFDQAIAITEKVFNEAKTKQDFDTQIIQLQALATIYFKKKDTKNAIASLKTAYSLASEKGKSVQAKKALEQLLQFYKSQGNDKESITLYEHFFNNFEKIAQLDSTLIDAKTFQITEEKIKQLEKEKFLKDELISKKNTFSYFLIGAMIVLLLFFALIAKALYSIKRKNKEIALQSLRREMNPHFIFNSLNSVNQFIAQNKELEANKYLTSYSNLMRKTMENSNENFITLNNEIEQLKKYLELEHLRFQDKFDFKIIIDEKLDIETIFIPNMIVQPHLENAIWHGLRYLQNKGLLILKVELKGGKVVLTINDNGIGISKSSELKTLNQKVHQSRGLTNTKERIALLNELYKKNISFHINEKMFPETGTVVEIVFPLITRLK